jgi:hypothetical protein
MIRANVAAESPEHFIVKVVVEDGGSMTGHEVTLFRDDLARLGATGERPDAFVHRCFEFLLAREPKESILTKFNVRKISAYFPEFESEIRG